MQRRCRSLVVADSPVVAEALTLESQKRLIVACKTICGRMRDTRFTGGQTNTLSAMFVPSRAALADELPVVCSAARCGSSLKQRRLYSRRPQLNRTRTVRQPAEPYLAPRPAVAILTGTLTKV